jgi:L-fuculose-phosphate aldolase
MTPSEILRYAEEREEVCAYGREMEERGLTILTSGNVSRRVEEGCLITPSNTPYPGIKPADVLLMDLDGNVVEGEGNPSVEHKVHVACYRFRDDVQGVIHSHPQVATAFAAARVPLPSFLDEFGVFVGEEVRVADYAMSGTPDIAENVVKALGEDSNAVFLASHGLVTVGRSLFDAMRVARMVERAAGTYLWTQVLGGAAELPEEARAFFRQAFQMFRTG